MTTESMCSYHFTRHKIFLHLNTHPNNQLCTEKLVSHGQTAFSLLCWVGDKRKQVVWPHETVVDLTKQLYERFKATDKNI